IKAVMIHTARDAGEPGPAPGEPGPDPVFGWGSIDALRAGRVIARTASHIIQYLAVSETNRVRQMRLVPNGTGEPIKVTVVWTDPPSQDLRTGLDDTASMLVNDLDVRLIAPDGQVYFPYSLNPTDPHARALNDRENRVDNVEVIEGAGALPGTWTVEVTAASLRLGPQQDFAIVISGLREL
ncbi:MAG TPA: hypothetical protein VGV38_00645, partial [Pyrinomonadaceae bacterium]|nr:hypothetical protein [Pyrinomonadaceae bacterium]